MFCKYLQNPSNQSCEGGSQLIFETSGHEITEFRSQCCSSSWFVPIYDSVYVNAYATRSIIFVAFRDRHHCINALDLMCSDSFQKSLARIHHLVFNI